MVAPAHATVLGAGIIGLSCAWRLAQRGWTVSVLDRGAPAGEASGAAAGILGAGGEHLPPELVPLARTSLLAWPGYAAELQAAAGLAVPLFRGGALVLATDANDGINLRGRVERSAGARWLDPGEASGVEPALAAGADVHGAALFPGDGAAVPALVAAALITALARMGVLPRRVDVRAVESRNGNVTGVRAADGSVERADLVVVAAGAWSARVEGTGLPAGAVVPVRGQMVAFEPGPDRPGRVVFRGHKYVVPREDGSVVAGSTMEHVGFDARVTREGVEGLLASAGDLFPALRGDHYVRAWAGLRPATVDGLPFVGPGTTRGLLLATGHFRNGILLAPATADLVARLAHGEAPPVELKPLLPQRLAA